MSSRLESISLISGPTPVVIIALGLGSVLLSFRWRERTWQRQLLLGVPITAAVIGVAAILVDGFALIPYRFPNSYYLWVGLVVLAFAVGVIGWPHMRAWRRVVAVLSVLLTTAMAITLINEHYQYYPTVGSAFGVDAQNQVSQKELAKLRAANHGALPQHGFTVQVAIPGTTSHFAARDAFVWLPPAWLADPKLHLPVIELLAGVPGSPSDWTRAGFADQTAREFADAHDGLAPIIVMPDANGSASADTECVNSPRGQAETYLTVDVPAFIRKTYGAAAGGDSLAIAGLSAGGFCALMLALRHPQEYRTFGDYSGLTSPTVAEVVDKPATTKALFGGSSADYDDHDPLVLLRRNQYPYLGGWFEVGTADQSPLAAQRQLVPLAVSAHVATCAVEIPGGLHDFDVWARSFKESLPWMSYRLGLTAKPSIQPASCGLS